MLSAQDWEQYSLKYKKMVAHPMSYASRALSPAEQNYGITDLETLAVVWAISHFRHYLYDQQVTIYTDHTACSQICFAQP